MKNVNYKLLKKYEIGKIGLNKLGYESGNLFNTSGQYSTGMYNFKDDASQIGNNILPQSLSNIGLYASSIGGMFTGGNYISPSAANAANIATYNQLDAAGKIANTAAKRIGTASVDNISQVNNAIEGAGGNVVKSGLTSAGTMLGVLGSMYGAYNTYNAALNFKNRITSQQMLQSAGKSYSNIGGEQFDSYDDFDASGIMDYTRQLNKADTANVALNTAGTAASIGGLVAGVPGAILAGLVGGIGGAIFGKSKSDKAEAEERRRIRDTRMAMDRYNSNSYDVALSKSMRNRFYESADKGKNPTYNNGKGITLSTKGNVGDIKPVHTSEGVKLGVQFGLAGNGEVIYNPENATASVFDEGKPRVDNIPTGVPLSYVHNTGNTNGLMKFNNGGLLQRMWDGIIILGNRINKLTGNTYAKDGRPSARILEQANKDDDMNINKHTRQLNIKNALNKLNTLANQQMLTANCGKNKFDEGKTNWREYASILAPRLLQSALILGNRQNYDPQVIDTHIPDTNSPAIINSMRSRRVNIDPLISNILNQQRQLIYANNNAGGISGGMRRALNQQLGIQSASAINALYADKHNKDIAQMNEADKLALTTNQANLARQQQASKDYATDLASAYGKAFDARHANLQTMINIPGQIAKDFNDYRSFLNSKDTQAKMLNIYQQNANNQNEELVWQRQQAEEARKLAASRPYNTTRSKFYSVLPSLMSTINPFTIS